MATLYQETTLTFFLFPSFYQEPVSSQAAMTQVQVCPLASVRTVASPSPPEPWRRGVGGTSMRHSLRGLNSIPSAQAHAPLPIPHPSSAPGLGFGPSQPQPGTPWLREPRQHQPWVSQASPAPCSASHSLNDLGLSFPNCTMKGWIECSPGASLSGAPRISDSGQEGLAEIFVGNGTSPILTVSPREMRKEIRPRPVSDPRTP